MPDPCPAPFDHSERDRSIVVNSYTTVVGRRSLSEEVFRAYWRDVHGPLCARLPGLGWYVQHHFARHHDTHLWPTPEGVDEIEGYQLDGAVEIGWASSAEQAQFQEASSILFSDEQNVFDETVAYALPQGSVTLVDRSPDPVPNGPDRYDRVHVHLAPRRSGSGGREDVMSLLTRLGERLAADHPAEVVKIRLHAPEPHDNATPNPPAPNVAHTVPANRVDLVVVEIAFTSPLARRRVLASAALKDSLGEQTRLVRGLKAFHVSGVHTYIRDAELSTAGLRGSRAAELIQALAAVNQVEDDVRRLLLHGTP